MAVFGPATLTAIFLVFAYIVPQLLNHIKIEIRNLKSHQIEECLHTKFSKNWLFWHCQKYRVIGKTCKIYWKIIFFLILFFKRGREIEKSMSFSNVKKMCYFDEFKKRKISAINPNSCRIEAFVYNLAIFFCMHLIDQNHEFKSLEKRDTKSSSSVWPCDGSFSRLYNTSISWVSS